MTEPRGDYVSELVRQHDRGRFVAVLFAPAEKRASLLALLAFNLELGRIPRTVSEPVLGQMRLQWWRDVVAKVASGGAAPAGHPVSEALAVAMRGLDAATLAALIDAREPELAGGSSLSTVVPVATALARVSLEALDVSDAATQAAARDAAIAYGLAQYLPVQATDTERAHVYEHIAAARAPRKSIDTRALPVLLWTTVAERKLTRPTSPPPVLRLMWKAWRGRY